MNVIKKTIVFAIIITVLFVLFYFIIGFIVKPCKIYLFDDNKYLLEVYDFNPGAMGDLATLLVLKENKRFFSNRKVIFEAELPADKLDINILDKKVTVLIPRLWQGKVLKKINKWEDIEIIYLIKKSL